MEEKICSVKCPACQTISEVNIPRQLYGNVKTDRSTCPKCHQVLSLKWRKERERITLEWIRIFDQDTLEVLYEETCT